MYREYSFQYDKWCACYDVNNEETAIINKFVPLKNAIILDIGCGTGRLTMRLAQDAKEVHGIDLDNYSIDVLNEKIAKNGCKNIKTYCQDILNSDFAENIFDIVVFSWSFYSLPKGILSNLFDKICYWLKDDGKMLILQPVYGQFEEVMRSVFVENQDHEEYDDCLDYIKTFSKSIFSSEAEFEIHQYFEFTDLPFAVEAIKMFAVTEGNYKDNIKTIKSEPIVLSLKKYFKEGKYILDDYVKGFVFSKSVFR